MAAVSRAAAWAGAVLLLCISGCGGAAPSQAPAAVPESPAGSAAPGVFAPAPPPPPPPTSPAEPEKKEEREARRSMAEGALSRAQRDLELAATDCAAACRALASMASATAHLCSIADEPPDQRRCEDAKERLSAARNRVRTACGTCP
jgi:hypothetical protein